VGGTGSPAWNGSEWEYNVQYPTFVATAADSGTKYKVVIGTTASNLANSACAFSESTSTVTLEVLDCAVLSTGILSFTGREEGSRKYLQWTTGTDDAGVRYVVERSIDGQRFVAMATITGRGAGPDLNTYTFTDVVMAAQRVQYRIRLRTAGGETFSRILHFGTGHDPLFNVVNPFTDKLQLTFTAARSEVVQVILVDMNGQVVHRQQVRAATGLNQCAIPNTATLPNGLYTVQLNGPALTATQRVLKQRRL
jgi:hypothetical protein